MALPKLVQDEGRARSIVFIDPGERYDQESGVDLTAYYEELAVNGGVVEVASMRTFKFPSLRQEISGTP